MRILITPVCRPTIGRVLSVLIPVSLLQFSPKLLQDVLVNSKISESGVISFNEGRRYNYPVVLKFTWNYGIKVASYTVSEAVCFHQEAIVNRIISSLNAGLAWFTFGRLPHSSAIALDTANLCAFINSHQYYDVSNWLVRTYYIGNIEQTL